MLKVIRSPLLKLVCKDVVRGLERHAFVRTSVRTRINRHRHVFRSFRYTLASSL